MDEKYFLQSPCRQRFYQIFVCVLEVLGLGNKTWWGYKPMQRFLHFHGRFATMIAPFCPLTQILYFYFNFNNLTFEVIGIVFAIFPVSVLVNINLMSAKTTSYKSVMKIFMSKIHISNYDITSNNYTRQKIILVERITRFTACFLVVVFGLNWFFWVIIPVFRNINNSENILNRTKQLQTCVYMWMPFEYSYNYRNWIVTHVFNVYVVGGGVMIMALQHCLYYMFLFHLIAHVQILKYTIRTGFVDNASNDEDKKKLIGIVKHHAFIIRAFDDVQAAFGVNVVANYLHNLFSDSLILYQVLNGGDAMSYIVMVGAYMGELVFMSFLIEEIRKQSCDLPDIVYSVPWENMAVSNQKMVFLILSRVQAEMQFIALGGFEAGVQPMVSILKTTFSYYLFLKTSIESKVSTN